MILNNVNDSWKQAKLAFLKVVKNMQIKNIVLPAVIILMTVAVLVLTGVQVYWIHQAVEVRDNQFNTNVNEALRVVANRLQMIETASIIIEATSKADEMEQSQPIPLVDSLPSQLKRPIEKPDDLTDYDKNNPPKIGAIKVKNGKKQLKEKKQQKKNCTRNVFITTPNNFYNQKESKNCSIMVHREPKEVGVKTSVENCKRQANEMHAIFRKLIIQDDVDTIFTSNPFLNNFGRLLFETGSPSFALAGMKERYSSSNYASSYSTLNLYKNNEKCFDPNLLKKQKLEQKANLIQQLIKELTVADRSIHERIDLATLDSILKQEIHNFGISRSFSYGIVGKDSMIASSKMSKCQIKNSPYKVRLFQYDLNKEPYILALKFLDEEPSMWAANSFVLSLAAASLSIILFSFGYTVFTINKQKKLSQMKTDFINNMTHEFKTPITTISLLSEMLSKTNENTKTDKIHKYANIIYDENRRLEDQVVRVLQMAEIDRKEIELNFVKVNVNECVENAINKVSVQVEQKGGKLFKELSPNVPIIAVDALHFSNIIFNLIDNANKYSPDIPEITVKTEVINDDVVISVIDKGIGMSADQIRHIFQKFYRVHTGNRHDVKGFGLGLSYVKSMIEAHGGRIKVKSEIGVGSRFDLIFPSEPKSI